MAPPRSAFRLVRRVAPWLVALLLLGVLLWRVPLPALADALRQGPALPFAAYVAAITLAILAADGWATWLALAVCGVRYRLGEMIRVRGATYLLGLINYAAGQGGIVFHLHRAGRSPGRLLGIVVFLLATNLVALAVVALAGSFESGAGMRWLAPVLAAGAAAYLLAVARPWPGLRDWPPTAPLLAAGLRGNLVAVGGRVLHLVLLVLAIWGGLRLWGVPVPLGEGLRRVPLVLLVAALPVTPGGLGTTQAAFVLLFADRAPEAGPAEREATLLAFALAWAALGYVAQAAVGFWCFRGPSATAQPGAA